MKTLFKSQELWELVETGFEDTKPAEPDQQLKEKRKKDSKALFIIQQALDEEIFPRIASATTSKEAWNILKQEYLGDKKVVTVRLQSLRREFETALMNDNESVQDYLSKVSSVVQQMRAYGEELKSELVVGKVLRSLTRKFDHVVAAIEESKDMETYTFNELMGSLQAHEERINRSSEKKEEKAFQAKEDPSRERSNRFNGRGRGRGGFKGRGRGRSSSGQSSENQVKDTQATRGPLKCYYCTKPGHKEANCWKKEKDQAEQKNDQKINFAEQEERLFLTREGSHEVGNGIWYIDSGCSNHMSSTKSMFKDLDETRKSKVRLGDDKQLAVEGVGTVAIKTEQGNIKLLHKVQYVPLLAYNLLSVGQLLNSGFSLLFDDDSCVVKDKKSNEIVATTSMGRNKMFSLDLVKNVSKALTVKEDDKARLWHLRFGHLNMQSLKLLSNKNMVDGLPNIGELGLCKGCIYGKQSRGSFPTGKAWRAGVCLELVHADLCGPMQTESLGGSRYFLLFTDDFSRMSWVYFLKSKSEAFEYFKRFKVMVETQSEKILKCLRTDRGGEFISKEFNEFCEIQGVKRELTAPYTPEQNGVAERKNRTVVEMARSMLRARAREGCQMIYGVKL